MSMLQAIGANIWVVDGDPIKFPAFEFPTRMTIVRCHDGELWVHSPVALTDTLVTRLTELGRVQYLVAPNRFHHLHVSAWAQTFPDALVYVVPGLVEKRPDLKFHAVLTEQSPPEWREQIQQVAILGNEVMGEWAFFHKESRTVILTDLVLNMRTDHLSWLGRTFARLDQIGYPNGGTPRSFRWTMRNRRAAKDAVVQILGWHPRAVVICHGELVATDGEAYLRKCLSWLLED